MQIPLSLTPKLLYAAENFVVHRGAELPIQAALQLAQRDGFGSLFIHGQSRAGKSHMAVYLMNELWRAGRCPRLLDAQKDIRELVSVVPDEVTIVDDFHLVSDRMESGAFVSFVERRRAAGAKVIFLSGVTVADLSFDEHVMSRLRAAQFEVIGPPDDSQMTVVFEALAKQRGFQIAPRNSQFATRRLRRDMASIESYLRRLERLASLRAQQLRRDVVHDAIGS